MKNSVDIDLTMTEQGYYDMSFTDGDFTKMYGFDVAILISLSCERRASESEIKEPQRRRGWVGNEINGFDDFEYGSKLWLLDQSRATQKTLNDSVTFSQQALQWFIDDNHVDSIVVTAEYNKYLELILHLKFVRNNDKTITKSFNLWQNTFVDGEI